MCEKRGSSESFMHGAIFGALAGVVIGLLVAPDKGEETRKKLKTAYSDYSEKGKYLVGEASAQASDLKIATKSLLDEIESRLSPLIEQAKQESPEVKEQVIGKIAQLTSFIEDTAEDVRKKGEDLKKKYLG